MIEFPPMRGWKKLGVVLLSAAGLVLIFGKLPRAQTLAKPANPWNLHAIESSFAGVRVREIDPSHSAVVFLYDLDNRTDSDYQLTKGSAVVVMSRLKSSGSLSSEKPA